MPTEETGVGGAPEEAEVPLKWFAAHVIITALKRTPSPANVSTSARVLVSEVDSNAFTTDVTLAGVSDGWAVRYLIYSCLLFFKQSNLSLCRHGVSQTCRLRSLANDAPDFNQPQTIHGFVIGQIRCIVWKRCTTFMIGHKRCT